MPFVMRSGIGRKIILSLKRKIRASLFFMCVLLSVRVIIVILSFF